MYDLLITGGELIDGSGLPRHHADIAITNGRIAAIGILSEPARKTIDATGLIVAPGVIDIHTHYDAQLFWDPAATPSSIHGVTTVFAGNCGFSIAPLEPTQASYLAQMLARVEGIPLSSLIEGVPWDWASFSEFLQRLEGAVGVNVGFLVGHTAMRRAVMGSDDERPATAEELAKLVALLHESLDAGGIGFSSSWATSHNDGAGRPVSSRYSEREELLALCEATGQHEGTTLEFIPSIASIFEDAETEIMAAMSKAADRPLNWNLLIVNTLLEESYRQRLEASGSVAALGGRVVPLTIPMMSTIRVNFIGGFILDSFVNWNDLFTLSETERLTELLDPARRLAMRRGVEENDSVLTRRMSNWANLIVGQTYTKETALFEGKSLGEIASGNGGDPFETLLDIVVADGLRTVIVLPPVGNDDDSWQMRSHVWKDERVVIGGSDSGAHVDMMDTFAYSTSFLGPIVRDGWIELEDAVRLVTDAPAQLYGVVDRGRIELGFHADLIIFDPDEIGPGEVYMRDDLPGDGSRLYSDAQGIDRVIVAGTEIVLQGEVTGALPGQILRSGTDTRTVRASTD